VHRLKSLHLLKLRDLEMWKLLGPYCDSAHIKLQISSSDHPSCYCPVICSCGIYLISCSTSVIDSFALFIRQMIGRRLIIPYWRNIPMVGTVLYYQTVLHTAAKR